MDKRKSLEPDAAALGTDPFDSSDGTLPYLDKLRERSMRPVASEGHAEPVTVDARTEAPERSRSETWPSQEPTPSGLLDLAAGLLLNDDEEVRISRIIRAAALNQDEMVGFSSTAFRRSLAIFKQLYKFYFRVESHGHEFIPEKGSAILAANHGGLLPFDGAMTIVDVLLRGQPSRLVRTIVDRWAGSLPFVSVFYSRVGQVVGTRANLARLLTQDQLVLIFPEGLKAMSKLAADRYRLQPFRLGVAKYSLKYRVPIIPTAIVGAEDQAPILYDIKPLARLLGLPVFPITPTFPLLGLPGLLPYPIKYTIEYGEPMHLYRDFRPGDEEETEALTQVAERVRLEVQRMVDRGVRARTARGGRA